MAKHRNRRPTERQLDNLEEKWSGQYTSANRAERIQVIYKISEEASDILTRWSELKTAVRGAIGSATQDDRKTITAIIRFYDCYSKSQINRAENQVENGERGMSLNHLLTLTRVEDRNTRNSLLNKSATEGWSQKVLRDKARGKSKQQVKIKPKRLADSINQQAERLIVEIDRLRGIAFLSGIDKIKTGGRDEAKVSFKKARESLSRLESRCNDATNQLKKAEQKIAGLL